STLTTINGATVADTFPAVLTNVTWTCSATPSSSCGATSGSGDINTTVNLAPGAVATFVVGTTLNASASGALSNTATVTAPGGITETDLSNNTATDTDMIA